MLNFDIQNHRPLREIVYEDLKLRILTGNIEPGTRMMEVELAEDMGVSRTPIREAIRKLEKEGLVTIEPRRGAYASQISTDDMVEILEVRQTMEGFAAQVAAEKIDAERLKEIQETEAAYREAVESGNTQGMIFYDSKFHRLIVEASRNKTLMQMTETLQELSLRFRYLYYDDFKRAKKMPEEHVRIIEAIKAGDSEGAKNAVDIHIGGLKQAVIKEGL